MINYRPLINLIWNSLNGIILALLSFLFTPLYSKLIGVENYAIINVWMITIVIVGLFDLGINLTLNNSLSLNESSGIKERIFLKLQSKIISRSLYVGFISLIFLIILYTINVFNLDFFKLYSLIAVSAIFQFLYQFYFNAYLGLQEHKKVNLYNINFNILKFLTGYVILFYSNSLLYFFIAQTLISIIQFAFLRLKAYKKIFIRNIDYKNVNVELPKLTNYTKQLTILSLSSIILAHIDRIWVYSTGDMYYYGNYAIAFVGASLIQLIIQPFYKTFFSKYSELFNSNNKNFSLIFISSTSMCTALLTVICINLVVYSTPLLNIWLGELYSIEIDKNFKLLTVGITTCGFFWLPAAFMQAQKLPKFHNKMIILAIVLSLLLLSLDKLNIINFSPTIVWLIHGLTLIVFESYYLYKKFIGSKIYKIFLDGLLYPFFISFTIIYLLNNFSSYNLISFLLSCIFSLSIVFTYYYKKNIIKHAFS